MSRSLYVAASEAESGKSAVALGLFDLMSRRVGRAAPFRPVVRGGDEPDPVVTLLRTRYPVDAPYESCVGVTYDDVHSDPDRAMGEIVSRYRALERECDAILVVGTDFTDVGAPTELSFNARLAANLGSPVLAVVILLAGRNTVHVLATLASDGLVPLVNTIAATLGGMAIVRRIAPSVERDLLIASGAGVGFGILISVSLLLGLAGLLSIGTAWGVVALLALLGAADVYIDQGRWRGAPSAATVG